MFQKRHYELVAVTLKQTAGDPNTIRDIAELFAIKFSADNPRFDRERFIAACGLPRKPVYTAYNAKGEKVKVTIPE